jgi:hypothetical protein
MTALPGRIQLSGVDGLYQALIEPVIPVAFAGPAPLAVLLGVPVSAGAQNGIPVSSSQGQLL